jgi:uncharacterized Zn finger protein
VSTRAPSAVTFSRIPPRRSTSRAATWWGRAWVRAVEEAAYADADLHAARQLSRSGAIGGITVDAGRVLAQVHHRADVWAVGATVPELDPVSRRAFVEVVAGESGHLAALMAGELPHRLVEQAEEAGVELLPYGGELGTDCTCDAWVDPCPHALAVLYQLTWLMEDDPFVLLQLRGLPRERLLARLHARTIGAPTGSDVDLGADVAPGPGPGAEPDLDTGLDAALRAARILELAEDPHGWLDHLF